MKKLFLSCLFFLTFVTISFSQSSIVVTPDIGVTVEILPAKYVITFTPSKYNIVVDSLSEYFDVNHVGPFCRMDFVDDIYDYLEVDGQPELPFYSLSLQLPDASSTAFISSISFGFIIGGNSYTYLPYPYVPCQDRNESSSDVSLHYDASYYSSSGTNMQPASISNVYSYLGTSGIEVTLCPIAVH